MAAKVSKTPLLSRHVTFLLGGYEAILDWPSIVSTRPQT